MIPSLADSIFPRMVYTNLSDEHLCLLYNNHELKVKWYFNQLVKISLFCLLCSSEQLSVLV